MGLLLKEHSVAPLPSFPLSSFPLSTGSSTARIKSNGVARNHRCGKVDEDLPTPPNPVAVTETDLFGMALLSFLRPSKHRAKRISPRKSIPHQDAPTDPVDSRPTERAGATRHRASQHREGSQHCDTSFTAARRPGSARLCADCAIPCVRVDGVGNAARAAPDSTEPSPPAR